MRLRASAMVVGLLAMAGHDWHSTDAGGPCYLIFHTFSRLQVLLFQYAGNMVDYLGRMRLSLGGF